MGTHQDSNDININDIYILEAQLPICIPGKIMHDLFIYIHPYTKIKICDYRLVY